MAIIFNLRRSTALGPALEALTLKFGPKQPRTQSPGYIIMTQLEPERDEIARSPHPRRGGGVVGSCGTDTIRMTDRGRHTNVRGAETCPTGRQHPGEAPTAAGQQQRAKTRRETRIEAVDCGGPPPLYPYGRHGGRPETCGS